MTSKKVKPNVDLKKFPYSQMRDIQKEVLEKLDKHWENYRYFLLECPPGAGKSGIAKTICASNKNAFMLTATKQLQDQYIQDFSSDGQTVSIKGKANYACNVQPGLNVECGPCLMNKELLNNCKQQKVCAYYNTREDALNANTALTSYPYFLLSTNCGRFWKQRDVLVLDECHLFENQLVQYATIVVSPKELDQEYNIKLSPISGKSGYVDNSTWLKEVWNKIVSERLKMLEEVKNALDGRDPESFSEDEMEEILATHSGYYQIDKLYKKFELFFESPGKDKWLVEPENGNLILTPVNVAPLFHQYVKKWGEKKIIFMSATILDIPGFCNSLGIKKEEVGIIRVESTFPPEKSPIIYKPCGSMNYNELDNTIPKIIESVKEILAKHPNEKGIIHSGNYKLARAIVDQIKDDRLIMQEQGENNEMLLQRHMISSEPTVLVSPSLTTGADLKDDLSRWQVVVKLPFLSMADKRVKKKMELDANWYSAEMFRTFIQAAGRSTRSEEDWSTTYVLDKSFYYFIMKHRNWFPKQFLKRIVWK